MKSTIVPLLSCYIIILESLGNEVFTEETHLFDYIAPSDETPNHLLLLYLNLAVFSLVIGIIFIVKKFSIPILSCVMIIMGALNIMFQVRQRKSQSG